MERVAGLLSIDAEFTALGRAAGLAFVLQVGGAGVSFGSQVLLGRWIGAAGYGTYASTLAWVTLLAVGTGLGFPTAVLRFVPTYVSLKDWSGLHGILRISQSVTLLVSVAVSVLGTFAVLGLSAVGVATGVNVILGLWLLPLFALMALQQETIRAFRRVGLAYAPSLLLRPLLVIVGGAVYIQSAGSLTSNAALVLTFAAVGSVVLIQATVFWRGVQPSVRLARPRYETRQWLRVAAPLLLIASFTVVLSQTDVVMVEALGGSQDAGLYAAASRTASLVSLVLLAVNAIAAPMFASLYAEKRHADLQRLVTTISKWIFWPSLGISMGLAALAIPILSLFGSEFGDARWILVILIGGQLVNAGAGAVGFLMILTGHQREAAWVYGRVAVVHLSANAVAIPLLGGIGAAIATAASLSLWNVWLYVLVVRRLDLHASVISPWLLRRRP